MSTARHAVREKEREMGKNGLQKHPLFLFFLISNQPRVLRCHLFSTFRKIQLYACLRRGFIVISECILLLVF